MASHRSSTRGRGGAAAAGTLAGLALVWALLANAGTAEPFETRFLITVPSGPRSIAVGHFDGDGDLDLAVACFTAQSVAILTGNGDGTFWPVTAYSLPSPARSVATGHFDGDCDLDLAVTWMGGGLSILLGHGDGTFGLPSVLGVTGHEVSTADVDGDTISDLVLIDLDQDSVRILLGNGDGTFAGSIDSETGDSPRASTIGHFDGDGDLDIAVVNLSGSVSVLLGNGDGTFAERVDYAIDDAYDIGSGHFDEDAALDLVVTRFSGDSVAILLGNGDGTFAIGGEYVSGAGREVEIGHFDDDADLDLAVTNFIAGTVSILAGNGDGTFAPRRVYSASGGPIGVCAGRFDDDTDLDLALANFTTNTVAVLLDTSPPTNGTFVEAPGSPFPVGDAPTALTAGHLDGDRRLDLVVVNASSDDISILRGNGDGNFEPKVDYATDEGPAAVCAGDFDGDRNMDLAVVHHASSSVSILLGNGDATFEPRVDYPVASAFGVCTGDFDGDADLDLAVTDHLGDRVWILLNDGDGTFAEGIDHLVSDYPVSVAAGRFDDDADLDLAVASLEGASVSVLLGNGDGTFAPRVDYPTPGRATAVSVGYFDDDTDADLVVTTFLHGVSILLGDGLGTFGPVIEHAAGRSPLSVATGWLDGDADLDVVVGYSDANSESVSIFFGNGDGTLAPRTDLPIPSASTKVLTGHFDDDTDLDVAVVSVQRDTVSVLLAVAPDITPPATSIALAPAVPDGANGWYVSDVAVSITADDGEGTGVAETRCALDPAMVPAAFHDLPAGCAVTSVTTDGQHVVYAASVDGLGNVESPLASAAFRVDGTPPVLTADVAAPGPVFLLGGGGGDVSAAVADATSGPEAASVAAAADVTSVGNKSVRLTGHDLAGNSSELAVPYRVSYGFGGFLAPIPRSSYRRGSTLPVRFRLTDVSGTRISDAEAAALLAPECRIEVRLDGVAAPGCPTYDPESGTFQLDVAIPRTLAAGTHPLVLRVSAPDGSGVVNVEPITVLLR